MTKGVKMKKTIEKTVWISPKYSKKYLADTTEDIRGYIALSEFGGYIPAKLTFEIEVPEKKIELAEKKLRDIMNSWQGFEADGYIENYIAGELFNN